MIVLIGFRVGSNRRLCEHGNKLLSFMNYSNLLAVLSFEE